MSTLLKSGLLTLAAVGATAGAAAPALAGGCPTPVLQEFEGPINAQNRNLDVALAGDRAIVGASENDGALLVNADTGAVISELQPLNNGPGVLFGESIDMNDGGRAVVSARRVEGGGRAYLFDTDTGARLHTFNVWEMPINATGQFAQNVAISDGLVAVTDRWASIDGEVGSGAVFVFDAETYELVHTLRPPDADVSDASAQFGSGLAINENYILVGDRFYELSGVGEDRVGAAFLYSAHTGAFLRRFDLGADTPTSEHGFGMEVELSGDCVFVGAWKARPDLMVNYAPGAFYSFDLHTGDLIDEVFPPGGQHFENFGERLDAFGDALVIAADDYNPPGGNPIQGRFFLYQISIGTMICAPIGEEFPEGTVECSVFGRAVAAGPGVVLTGCKGGNFGGASAYLVQVPDLGIFNPSDLTGDGLVTTADLGVLLAAWGTPGADLTGDGVTDSADLGVLLAAWSP